MIGNQAAITLYEQHGYRRLATLPHYYQDGSDGWRYEKPLRWFPSPAQPQLPYVHQTTPFTCGPACLMMAMAGLDRHHGIDPDDELRIWREATTVFMTSGHGGCGPHGLALAAHGRGFDVRVVVSEPGPLFIGGVRSAAKKAVMEKVHQIFERDMAAAGLHPEIAATTPEDLEAAIAGGWIPLLLVSSWRFNREKTPHWVVVTGIDDRFLLVHDPDMDEELMKTGVDCTHVPIPRSAFATMARYGRAGLQAAVYVRRRVNVV